MFYQVNKSTSVLGGISKQIDKAIQYVGWWDFEWILRYLVIVTTADKIFLSEISVWNLYFSSLSKLQNTAIEFEYSHSVHRKNTEPILEIWWLIAFMTNLWQLFISDSHYISDNIPTLYEIMKSPAYLGLKTKRIKRHDHDPSNWHQLRHGRKFWALHVRSRHQYAAAY